MSRKRGPACTLCGKTWTSRDHATTKEHKFNEHVADMKARDFIKTKGSTSVLLQAIPDLLIYGPVDKTGSWWVHWAPRWAVRIGNQFTTPVPRRRYILKKLAADADARAAFMMACLLGVPIPDALQTAFADCLEPDIVLEEAKHGDEHD